MFRKRKAEKRSAVNVISDKAAIRIACFFMGLQDRFARFMNSRTSKFSVRTWKFLILLFAVTWGGLSTYFMFSAFEKHPVEYKRSRIQFIEKLQRNDSLAFMEEIYEHRNNKQVQSKSSRNKIR